MPFMMGGNAIIQCSSKGQVYGGATQGLVSLKYKLFIREKLLLNYFRKNTVFTLFTRSNDFDNLKVNATY